MAKQLVFLDFDTFTDPGEIEYSSEQRSQILANISADYALFDFDFTLTKPTKGEFSTLFFNAGPTGGLADKIDFRNLDKNDTATININGLDTFPGVTVVGLSSFIGAHELGHLQGLRHGDSFGPIGSGLPTTGVPPNSEYSPPYPGPANANETTSHIMASPASVGQMLSEANESAFFSERSAVKLAFNEKGTVISEEEDNNSIDTAQAIEFVPLDVPNTLLSGDNAGKDFLVEALVITGSMGMASDRDFFSFAGKAGDLFQFEVISNILSFTSDSNAIAVSSSFKDDKFSPSAIHNSETIQLNALNSSDDDLLRIADPIDPQISIFDSSGNLVPYFTGEAFNDDEFEFESIDSILIDLELPEDDTYFIKVNAFSSDDIGEYELFGYQFTANEAPTLTIEPIATIDENGIATLTGTITDPDTSDSFTLDIDWGDPLSPNNTETFTFNPSDTGSQTFTLQHQYLDDNPSRTPSDTYTISAKVTDENGSVSNDTENVNVNNAVPIITALTAESIFIDDDDDNGSSAGDSDDDEGVLITVNGTFTDSGSLDLHTGKAIWSDGVSTELTVDNDKDTFTTTRLLSEDELEDNFPEVSDNSLGFDDAFLVGITTTIEDDDTGIAREFREFIVSEESGIV